MSVRIRLSRIGKKKVPFFRIIAVDERKKRDGAFLDNIGTYDALKGKVITFEEDLMQEWISKGALPTDAVKKIYRLHKKSNSAQEVKKAAPKKKTKTATKK